MTELWKGAPAADALIKTISERTGMVEARGVTPTLAILRAGEDESDLLYERKVIKCCEKTGICVRRIVLPADVSQQMLTEEILEVNRDDTVHGCLLLRPLPRHMDEHAVCEALEVQKDVDCATSRSMSAVFTGRGEGFAPCTAQACIELLDYYGVDLTGRNVAVIGRSLVIGRPVAMMLLARNATVTMCHTKTTALAEICKRAEILIVAAGVPGLVDARFTNPEQIIIDVGINVGADGSVCGDVRLDGAEVRALTPVPGGVGTVTTTVLCRHVIEAAERACASKA